MNDSLIGNIIAALLLISGITVSIISMRMVISDYFAPSARNMRFPSIPPPRKKDDNEDDI
jgi:hypothetical protein